MNFKKVAFIPLMALLLVGCGTNTNRGGKGSSSGSQGGDDAFDVSEPAGEVATKEASKQALASAATSLLGQNSFGFDLAHTELEGHMVQKAFDGQNFIEAAKIDASVSDVTLKARVEGLQSQNPNQDFKASLDLGLTADVKAKVATGADETTGAIQYTNINLGGSAAAKAFMVGNQPYVSIPESNAKLFNDVVTFLTENEIIEADDIPEVAFPMNYKLMGLDLDLSMLPAAIAQIEAEDLNEGIGELVDELSEMPAELGTLKFIKESESKYALYADINYSEPVIATGDDQDYLLGSQGVAVKGYVEFDTTVGLTKIAVQASYAQSVTLVGQYGPDELEGLTKEQMETVVQDIRVSGQAQVNFVYGNDAKADIPADLTGYVELDLGAMFGGSSEPEEGLGE